MAYRNGTYIAFHAGGSSDPTASDIRYYRLLKAWHESDDVEFRFVNSHEKAAAVRDTSKKETLQKSLRLRLNNSKNMVLVIGPTTRNDRDWVPFEIAHAVDVCALPIIAAYTSYESILAPVQLRALWPSALARRIDSGAARVIHIPFKRNVIDAAIRQYNIQNRPPSGLAYYTKEAQRLLGVNFSSG